MSTSGPIIVFVSLLVYTLLVGLTSQQTVKYEMAADYVAVDQQNGANIFYWLYKLRNQDMTDNKPIVVWLQGGPGASSALGDFCEVGPVALCGEDEKPQNRTLTWMNHANALIFVDQPVGSGFSYVLNEKGYAKSEEDLVRHFIIVMKNMYERFPVFHNKPLWIFSESYGGKMNSHIAVGLLKEKIPGLKFTGIGLGNSWISPQDAVNSYGRYLQALSHSDDQSRDLINSYAKKIEAALVANQFELATNLWGEQQEVISKVSGDISFYNFLRHTEYSYDRMTQWMNTEARRMFNRVLPNGKQIPDDVKWVLTNGPVFEHLVVDFMQPSISQVEQVLNYGVKVVVYSGQLDVIVDILSTEAWISKMKGWSGLNAWQKAAISEIRPKLPQPEDTSGILGETNIAFRKKYTNLELWKILYAGHMVPQDNPLVALEMFRRVTDESYDKLRSIIEMKTGRSPSSTTTTTRYRYV